MENDKVKFKNEFKARLYKWKVKNNFAILNCNFDFWYLHFDIESGRALTPAEIQRLYNLGRWPIFIICYNTSMTTLLEKAVKKLGDLPKKLQNNYASIIFEELDNEARWDKLFSGTSGKKIKKMEKIARSEIKKKTNPLDQFLKI